MAKVTGVVSKKGAGKFGGEFIMVDGNYYNSKFSINAEVGDTVEFDSGTTGKYVNKLIKLPNASAPATVSKSSYSKDNEKIVRQNALRHATMAVCTTKSAATASDEELVQRIVSMATAFVDYINDVDQGPTPDAQGFINE